MAAVAHPAGVAPWMQHRVLLLQCLGPDELPWPLFTQTVVPLESLRECIPANTAETLSSCWSIVEDVQDRCSTAGPVLHQLHVAAAHACTLQHTKKHARTCEHK